MKMTLRAVSAALLALCLCGSAFANVVIGNTRVVFPAQDGEVTVRLTNDNTYPVLIESWIDDGDEHATPDTVHTPFLITPPLFRMESHKDQSLRIIATPAQLPSDRESLFWLNVLEVPPKPTSLEVKDKNLLQFAFRSRIKMFYRPANLPGDPLKAPAQVTWKASADGQDYGLEVRNPTPYHITVIKLVLDLDGQQYTSDSAGMVAPQGTLRLPLKGLKQRPAVGSQVTFDIINDFGATTTFKGSVGQ